MLRIVDSGLALSEIEGAVASRPESLGGISGYRDGARTGADRYTHRVDPSPDSPEVGTNHVAVLPL